jgi:hypothetical protein
LAWSANNAAPIGDLCDGGMVGNGAWQLLLILRMVSCLWQASAASDAKFEGHSKAHKRAHSEAQFCYPPFGIGLRHSDHSRLIGPLGPAYDNDLYACHQQEQARCRKPPGLNVFQDNAFFELSCSMIITIISAKSCN